MTYEVVAWLVGGIVQVREQVKGGNKNE